MRKAAGPPAKVVLFGFYGAGNFGDELMLYSLLMRLTALMEVVVVAYDFFPLWVESDSRLKIRVFKNRKSDRLTNRLASGWRIFREILRADCVAYGGGTFFFDNVTSSYRNMFAILRVVIISRLLRKRVLLLGSGVGELTTPQGRGIAAFILRNVQYIALRDEGSLLAARELLGSARRTVVRAADLIFLPAMGQLPLMNCDPRREAPFTLAFCGMEFYYRKGVGITEELFSGIVAEALDCLIERYLLQIHFVPMQIGPLRDDHRIHGMIRDKMANRAATELMDCDGDRFTTTLCALQQADLVTGMRLHSLETAVLLRTPVTALVLTQKVQHFMRDSGLAAYAVELSQVTEAELLIARIGSAIEAVQQGIYPAADAYIERQRELAEYNLSPFRQPDARVRA